MIVRPMTFHGRPVYSSEDHPESVIQRIIEVCGGNGVGRKLLKAAGVELYMGFGLTRLEAHSVSSYSELIENAYAGRDVSQPVFSLSSGQMGMSISDRTQLRRYLVARQPPHAVRQRNLSKC